MNKYWIIFLMCAVIISIPSICFSQEENTEEDTEYSYGTVVAVNKDSNEVTISEYDWENDMETNVIYSIDPKVQIEGVTSWKEISVGSYVDIEYVEENGKKIAKYISVYTEEPTEEETSEEEYE